MEKSLNRAKRRESNFNRNKQIIHMVKTKVMSSDELVELLDKAMEENVVDAEKAAHGGELVVKYKE